ncbi:MAG: type II toxin-antitoxin system prevent-host-death family antitoxin [Actinobacteria bacterium ATB1]|nr:type II toxin-antitoxin system prevent-host-death family antitoxin [Actinobacteria bacterium ATB1]
MDVAVRELKAKLSAYLQRAAAGELITVTDRGRPIAVLGPVIGRVDLDAAAEAGWLTPASATGLVPVRRHPPLRSVLETLEEDRAE